MYSVLVQVFHKKEVNEIRAERIAKNANPLALVAVASPHPDPYYQEPKSHKPYAPISKQASSTRSNASTKFKGKQIAKPITPPSESASEEDSTQVVQQTGIQCFNCKEFGHFAKECRKLKRVKDNTYHKEKMLCKQAEKGVPLQEEQSDWLADTDEEIDEQELEATMYKLLYPETDQNAEDERVALANLIANFKLDVDIVQLILFIVDFGCTKHLTINLKLLFNFVENYLDADLEVAFWKSTCFVRDLQGNDLLTSNHGSDLYTISLQETSLSTPIYFMAKALPTQACKEKRSSFKTKDVPSSKGRLNLLHMDLCGPMRVASINGKKYILAKCALEIPKKQGMQKCDTVGTPMATKPKLDVDLSGKLIDQTDYRSKIGSLMYLTSSRPDIVQAYPKDSGFELTTFSDADHARYLDTRKITSGGIQFLGDKLVSWMSKKQDYTKMSSTEAEYVALSVGCAQVMWMRTQLKDYGFNYNKIPLYCNS
ncbi:retrovirus-related pol polyprotein from transposon TNT 1-94 [Tanacetum coccineum]|uniref:Retrovirus-related pol polyprotein from transposon TNT 1-94 n=1 Tax=Tanacetum coccineum TaxID=301880 RepID=A0ABQ5FTA3_9ASTR